MKLNNENSIEENEKNNILNISPKNNGEKRKDQGNIIMTIITVLSMTMTEIGDPETVIGHIVETDHKTIRDEYRNDYRKEN